MKLLDSDNVILFIIKNIKECWNDVMCFFFLFVNKKIW